MCRPAFVDHGGKAAAWSTAIQGDLDHDGKVLARIKQLWDTQEVGSGLIMFLIWWSLPQAQALASERNPEQGEFGTHTRLLWAAAMATQ